METSKTFDVIVIGAGAGGLNIASFTNRVGLKVLLIDKSDRNIGGDCLNYGCVPSKSLIHVARKIKAARTAEAFGLHMSGDVDMERVRQFVDRSKEVIRTHENAEYFRQQGMDVVLGEAKFSGKNNVVVNGVEYQGKKIVIATGSRPRELSIPGSENVTVYTNESIFDIPVPPKRLVVIGGGPIGLEIGQAFRYLGSEVIIVSASKQLLPREDGEVAEILAKQLYNDGVKIYFEHTASHFDSSKTLVIQNAQGEQKTLEFDAIFSAIGRDINIYNLDAEKAGISLTQDERRFMTDDYLRTTNTDVIVCGDAFGQAQFTHEAERHASIILNNFFSPFKKKLDNTTLAWSTFTYPEVATFGRSEQDLKSANITFDILRDDFVEDDRAIIDQYPESLVKLFVSKGKIMGGTMIAPLASEIVQELILAQNLGISIDKIFTKTYPYPIATRINKRVISKYLSKKLTEKSKRLLCILFH